MRALTLRIAPPVTLRIVLLAALLLATAPDLFAQGARSGQDSVSVERSGWIASMSIGVPGYQSDPVPELFTIGGQWTQLRAGRLGADFALGTMPSALAAGVVVLGARGGVALPLALAPGVLLLPSGGVSLLGGAGAGGGGGIAGLNAGLAAVVLGPNGAGLRTGVTWHRFDESGEAIWLWEIGFVRGPRSR